MTPVRSNRSRAPITLDPRSPFATARGVRAAEVVHVHEPLAPLVGPATFLGSGPPVVGTFHADPSRVIRSLYRLGAPLLRRLVARLRRVTAVSEVAGRAIRPFAGEVSIIPNGVHLAGFAVSGSRHPLRVAFVGRDEPRKGLDVLLAAWPRVVGELPEAELVVIGTRRRNGPARTRFLGPSGGEAKRRELAAATVLCAPNLGGESFGLVLVEGMAAGCTVVASDLDAFRAVAGGEARFVPPGDSGALAAALISALRLPVPPDRPRRAAARFDWSVIGPMYLNEYERAAQ